MPKNDPNDRMNAALRAAAGRVEATGEPKDRTPERKAADAMNAAIRRAAGYPAGEGEGR